MVSQVKTFQSPFKTIFFTVEKPKDKINFLLKTVYEYFENKKNLLILVPNSTVLEYVDKLLWEHSQTSFLPHDIQSQTYSKKAYILIALSIPSDFSSQSLFNLSDQPINVDQTTFSTIYEFEEISTESKKKSFQNKIHYYKSQNRRIISL